MRISSFVFAALLGALAPVRAAFGQSATPEAGLTAAVARAEQQYNASFFGHPQLLNGPEYVDYSRRYHARTGHQFFGVLEPQAGTVFYNGHYFQGLLLTYDVVLDQVLTSPPDSPLTLSLIDENVRYFTINNHRFVRLVADSTGGSVIRTGYYELLADGPVQVLARRAKRQQEHVTQFVDVEFTSNDKLFIRKAGVYYLVSSKGAAMRLFADRGKEAQAYAKEQKLSFKKARLEASVVQLATHYSSLTAR